MCACFVQRAPLAPPLCTLSHHRGAPLCARGLQAVLRPHEQRLLSRPGWSLLLPSPGTPVWTGRGLLDFNLLFNRFPDALPKREGGYPPDPPGGAFALLREVRGSGLKLLG
jgi:hypothetical protein